MLPANFQYNPIAAPMCPNHVMLPISEQTMSSFSQYPLCHRKVLEIPPEEFAFEGSVKELIGSANLRIEKAKSGINGVPILYNDDTNEPIAVFKEYTSILTTINWGDLLAYRLDHGSFANVPLAFRLTSLSEKAPKKFLSGVFVKWIPNTREMTVAEQFYLSSGQREAIAILDMRLGNSDRHSENVLVGEDGNLTPIDHDRTFSEYKSYSGACFKDMPISKGGIDYILNLDINYDVKILREFDVTGNEISNYVIRTIFLKLAAEASCHSLITLGWIEDTIQSMKLPTGKVGIFFENWIYSNSLRLILSQHAEPYNENELKRDFKEIFDGYFSAPGITSFVERGIRSLYC